MWMNQWDVEDMVVRYGNDPALGPAVMTLGSLMSWTNSNSDGWASWPKPARSAERLVDLIQQHDRHVRQSAWHLPHAEATPEAVAAALRPIKAFRTRMAKELRKGCDFEIFTSTADIHAAVRRRREAADAAERAELARLQEKYGAKA